MTTTVVPAVALLLDEVPHVEPPVGVEAGRGLVEEEHLGPPEQGGRQRQALLLPARETSDRGAGELVDAEPAGRLVDVGGRGVEPGEMFEQADRLAPTRQTPRLQHDSDAGPVVSAPGQRVLAEHRHRSGGGPRQPHGTLDGRGLAGPVRPEHRRHPTGRRLPRQAVYGHHRPERPGELEQVHGGRTERSRRWS